MKQPDMLISIIAHNRLKYQIHEYSLSSSLIVFFKSVNFTRNRLFTLCKFRHLILCMQPFKFWAKHGFCESCFSATKDENGVEAGVDEWSTKLAADDGVVASSTLEGISAT